LAEDHVRADLLFAGTEFGLFVTLDGGKKWTQLKGGLPTVAVRDLAVQRQVNDLVVGTFGRGIYVLDDYAPLRTMTPEALQEPAVILTVVDADGRPVRTLTGPTAAGLHRVTWDLREPQASRPRPQRRDAEQDPTAEESTGPLVLPGRYAVAVTKRVDGVTSPLAGPVEFSVVADGAGSLPEPERKELADF